MDDIGPNGSARTRSTHRDRRGIALARSRRQSGGPGRLGRAGRGVPGRLHPGEPGAGQDPDDRATRALRAALADVGLADVVDGLPRRLAHRARRGRGRAQPGPAAAARAGPRARPRRAGDCCSTSRPPPWTRRPSAGAGRDPRADGRPHRRARHPPRRRRSTSPTTSCISAAGRPAGRGRARSSQTRARCRRSGRGDRDRVHRPPSPASRRGRRAGRCLRLLGLARGVRGRLIARGRAVGARVGLRGRADGHLRVADRPRRAAAAGALPDGGGRRGPRVRHRPRGAALRGAAGVARRRVPGARPAAGDAGRAPRGARAGRVCRCGARATCWPAPSTTSTTPGDAFLRGLLPLAGALLVGGGTVVLAFLILPAAGIALAACLVARLRARPADHRPTGGPHRDGRRRAAGAAHPAGHRDARRGTGTRRARARSTPGSPSWTGWSGAPRGWRPARRERPASPPGSRSLAMGAAVWLAAWFGVPAVVDADLEPGAAGGDRADPAGPDRHRAGGRGRRVDAAPVVRGGPPAVRGAGHPAGDRAGARATRCRCRPTRRRAPTIRLRGRQRPLARRRLATRCTASTSISSPGRRIVVLGPVRIREVDAAGGAARLPDSDRRHDHRRRGRPRRDGLRTRPARLFGWCDQRAYLFDSSLAENVRLARPAATDDEVDGRARAAGAGALAGRRCRTGLRHPGRRARPGGVRRRAAADRAGQGAAGRPAGAAGRRAGRAPGRRDGGRGDRDDHAAGGGSHGRAGHPPAGRRRPRRRGLRPGRRPALPARLKDKSGARRTGRASAVALLR